jgi:hypothetical protein
MTSWLYKPGIFLYPEILFYCLISKILKITISKLFESVGSISKALACRRKKNVFNLGRHTGYSEIYRAFFQPFQANAGIVLQLRHDSFNLTARYAAVMRK